MSRQPLLQNETHLPIAANCNDEDDDNKNGINITAAPVIQCVCFPIFLGTAIISTVWASRSQSNNKNTTPGDLNPNPHQPRLPPSAPLLPYFASLSLITEFCFWIGYLFYILHDAIVKSAFHRKLIVKVSVAGKVVLGVIHMGMWVVYRYFYGGLTQPNWVLVFLAAQAWWDIVVFGLFTALRRLACNSNSDCRWGGVGTAGQGVRGYTWSTAYLQG